MAATMHNIRVIVGIIITSHMGIAYHLEHNGQDMLPHHSFSLLISVECACGEHYPSVFCSQYNIWRAGHYLPNRTVHGPVAENLCLSKIPEFIAAKKSKIFDFRLFKNTWNRQLVVWCTVVNTSVNLFCFNKGLQSGRKCVQFNTLRTNLWYIRTLIPA